MGQILKANALYPKHLSPRLFCQELLCLLKEMRHSILTIGCLNHFNPTQCQSPLCALEFIADTELQCVLKAVTIQLATGKGVLIIQCEEHLLIVQLRTNLCTHRELVVRTVVP